MSHAQVEELSDSDPEIDDPSTFLPDSDQSIIQRADIPSSSNSNPTSTSRQHITSTQSNPTLFRPPPPQSSSQSNTQARESIKTYQTLYPCYFDSTRTRAQGRRVSSNLAIPNPLAYNLLAAAKHAFGSTNLQMAFEPDKTHPKDWSNPGRIRIQMRDRETHKPCHPHIKSKAHLYVLMGKYLKDNPTKASDPLQLKIQGLPVPENFTEMEVPRPRGWKMGQILPVHSCAISGGGVKDDFFKEAMAELQQAQGQGQLPAGGGGGGGGGGMPDMSALQGMMNGMGGGAGGEGGAGAGGSGGGGGGGKKKKDKKKG